MSSDAQPNGASDHPPDAGLTGNGNGTLASAVNGHGLHPGLPVVAGPATGIGSKLDALAVLKALRRRLLLAVVLGVLVGTGVGLAVWFFLPPAKRTAVARLIVPENPEPWGLEDNRRPVILSRPTQMASLKSRLVYSAALKREPNLALDLEKEHEDVLDWIDKELKAEFPQGSEILNVSFSDKDPVRAKLLVSAIVQAYLDEVVNRDANLRAQRLERLQLNRTYYEEHLEKLRENLQIAARGAGASQDKALAIRQEMAQELQRTARQELAKVRAQKRTLELERLAYGKGNGGPVVIPEKLLDEYIDRDEQMVAARKHDSELEAMIAKARVGVRDPENDKYIRRAMDQLEQHRAVTKQLRQRLRTYYEERLKENVKNNAQADLDRIQRQLDLLGLMEKELEKDVVASAGKADTILNNSLELERAQWKISYDQDMIKRLTTEIDRLEAEHKAPPRIRLHDDAFVTYLNEAARRWQFTLGAGFGGFALVLVGVALLEWRARRLESVDEVATRLGMRVVGTLPACPGRVGRRLMGSSAALTAEWHTMLAESVDSARTMLLHAARDGSLRIAMVTSAVGGEGKTSLTTHLAASLARAGRKTLLVDCDLRNPAAHRLFELPQAPGFSELLRGEAQVADVIRPTPAENLWLVPAGRCDAEALAILAQDGAQKLFDELRPQFDFILVDSSPVLPVADSLLLAQHVDGVLFSLLREVSRLPKVYAAYQRLAMLGVPMLGAVVNGTQADRYGYGRNYVFSFGS